LRQRIVIFCLFLFFFLWLWGDLTNWENISVCLFIYFLFDFLENLGKKIVILELTNIMASLTCLLMPVVFYHQYTIENHLARIWVKYMPINSDDYFSFMVPAVIALAAGLRIPLIRTKVNKNPKEYMENVRRILQYKPNLGLILIAVGVTSGLLDVLLPKSLEQFFYYLDHLTFVGVFYVIYSPNKHKKYIVPGVILLMIGQSLVTGMFGDLVFILACAVVLILLGTNISFQKKLLTAVAGVLLILIMQSVKGDYRKRTWHQDEGADPAYYAQLVAENVLDPSRLVEPYGLFQTLVRMNQGWLVAFTMKRVPEKYDFAHGETIWQSVAAAIVPRFLWRDKPEAGGKANLKRFWGYNLVGFSMNIGPFGEAYANFDRTGGIIYMFFYGLLFGFLLTRILKFADKSPTIVLWLPFLFFYSIGVETDLLSTMGFLIKGLFFTWLIFKVFRVGFRIDL
jgi:hypothetical protein